MGKNARNRPRKPKKPSNQHTSKPQHKSTEPHPDQELTEELSLDEKTESTSSPETTNPSLTPPQDEPNPAHDQSTGTSITKKEKIYLIALCAILLGIFCITMCSMRSLLPNNQDEYQINLPAKGERITLKNIDIYWRRVQREGEQPDQGVKLGTTYIPAATLTLHPKTENGHLRCFFENHQGKIVGDPVELNINHSHFSNGTPETEIYCTHGIQNIGDMNHYMIDPNTHWKLTIKEAPTPEATSTQLTKLLSVKIPAIRR